MLYGLRDEQEFAVAGQVIELAYLAAGGASPDDGRPLGRWHHDDPDEVS
jgi:hypothetical protein